MNGLVSVIIPAYNAQAYLAETVSSVLRQSVPPAEILIVDDESRDNTLAIAQELAAQHSLVAVVARSNGGCPAARNTGLARAVGEFVLFLDADDRLHENAIRDHLRGFSDQPAAAMVFGANDVIDAQGVFLNTNPTDVENITLEDVAMYATPCASQCLYRRAPLLEMNGYNETFRYAEDIDLNLRLARRAAIYSHGAKVMDYRRHATQSTTNGPLIGTYHLAALEGNLGPASAFHDAGLLKRAKAKWHCRYGDGQFRAALGAIKRGRFADARASARFALLRFKARSQGAN